MKKLLLALFLISSVFAYSQKDSIIVFDKYGEFVFKLPADNYAKNLERLYYYDPVRYDRVHFIIETSDNKYYWVTMKATETKSYKKPREIKEKI